MAEIFTVDFLCILTFVFLMLFINEIDESESDDSAVIMISKNESNVPKYKVGFKAKPTNNWFSTRNW